MGTFGVIYVAFGPAYLAMALVSMVSLRVTNPHVPVCIVTNVVDAPPTMDWWKESDIWTFVGEDTSANRNAKTSIYKLSPFDQTLFLDCDTMVLGDLSPLTRYLEHFDVLLTWLYRPNEKTKRRILDGKFRYTEDGHFNSGVIAFRRGDKSEEFFRLWNQLYNQMGYRLDQPSLVETHHLAQARVFPLPYIWNSGDKWRDWSKDRQKIVVWHYKYRPEPQVKRLILKAVRWFGGNGGHLNETRKFLHDRRNHRSLRWVLWRVIIKIRGEQSRRLEQHSRKAEWIRWTR